MHTKRWLVGGAVLAAAIPAVAFAAIDQVDPSTVPTGFLVASSRVPTGLKVGVIGGRTHRLADGEQVYVQHAIIPPGGTTGWHSHAGPVIVLMVKGSLTYYPAKPRHREHGTTTAAPGCPGTTYAMGEGFVDPGFGFVHNARNEGTVPAEFYATYVLPAGAGDAGVKIPQPGAGNPACPF